MSSAFKFEFVGVGDLAKKLQELDTKMTKQVLSAAAKAGATLIRDRARQLVPVDTGYLARRGITARRTKRKKHYVEYSVGYTKKGFYGRFLELGTQAHNIGKSAKIGYRYTGAMHPGIRPRPHLRPAFDEKKAEAVAVARTAAIAAIREVTG